MSTPPTLTAPTGPRPVSGSAGNHRLPGAACVAIVGGAGHLASSRFHADLLAALLARGPITSDTDLPDLVHLSFGLGAADGGFTVAQTSGWVARNRAVLDRVAPDLVVAVCNTVQPALGGLRRPVLDNFAVLDAAVSRRSRSTAEPNPASGHGWLWLASAGAYQQGLVPAPAADVAGLAGQMIWSGMNGRPDPTHATRLATLAPTGVVLACTDLYGYAPLLRGLGVLVVEVVEELVAATTAALEALPSRMSGRAGEQRVAR